MTDTFDINEFLEGGEPCNLFEEVHQEIMEERWSINSTPLEDIRNWIKEKNV